MMIFFSFVGEGGGRGGRGHLKSLRLQPGKGAGEKRSNEEGGGGGAKLILLLTLC